MADENLFELALREIDSEAASHPVFSHIMTTSNLSGSPEDSGGVEADFYTANLKLKFKFNNGYIFKEERGARLSNQPCFSKDSILYSNNRYCNVNLLS